MANQLQIGDKVLIEKGCRDLGITKGATARVTAVVELGADYSHSVKVQLHFLNSFASGKYFGFYARHINRLSDDFINLNNGNPLNKIVIKRK